jgi:hypothetical protein
MPRLYKFALFGFLAYAMVTATPAQQAEIGRGVVAIKDAAFGACTRSDSPCTLAVEYAMTVVSGAMSNEPAPWMDDSRKEPVSIPQSVTVRTPAQR